MADRGAVPVLNDPQFGLTAILRPYDGFDNLAASAGSYQGVGSIEPIMFSEGGQPLDSQASQPGYSTRLLKGLPVPYGARLSIWIPMVTSDTESYVYFIVWRLRNVFDYRTQRKPFHYPKQGAGVTDTVTGDSGSRLILPAAMQCIDENDPSASTAKTVGGLVYSRSIMLSDTVAIGVQIPGGGILGSSTVLLPRLPNGLGLPILVQTGRFGQGITPATAGFTNSQLDPSFMQWEVQAQGDELLLGCIKDQVPTVTPWTFGGTDARFSYLYGRNSGGFFGAPVGSTLPDMGIYVTAGVST